ncbi:transposable element Tcb1 transposase [Trichonephila clavipes]|nr:transposable element Tcb1 transposase [Trichonephila clavipes]
MACERKLIESEATTGFFVLLVTKGKKETLEWCMKANLIASRYECPRFKKMRLQERKGTVDGYEWRCRNQSKDNRHDIVRSVLATAIFQQDNARPHVARIAQRFFVNHQIELLPWPALSPDLSPIENMWSMVAQRLTQITPQRPHQINFGNIWKLLGLLYPKNTYKVSLNQCRGVWQR